LSAVVHAQTNAVPLADQIRLNQIGFCLKGLCTVGFSDKATYIADFLAFQKPGD
jgi:hypothetical protein